MNRKIPCSQKSIITDWKRTGQSCLTKRHGYTDFNSKKGKIIFFCFLKKTVILVENS